MTRGQVKRRLALAWWRQVLVAVAPVLVLNLLFGDGRPSVLAMPLFIAGMASMFLSLPLFHAYKRALITTGKALDSEAEPAAWLLLDRVRMRALLGAALPAWIAALAVLAGLEAVPLVLLTFSSVVIHLLYRIPRQLG
ncbi:MULTISPECIES: MFS transporter [Pseudomonadaceae]|uniref:MFS transporter n=1 Tax=Pseudomonadaceae TaxID=135621 RepID=UPI0019D14FC1|nr:MFS transporter [Pseudomonas chengduensis]MBN7117263.1 MFS transporter [Pseudomonas oleovorans]MBN7133247.1 MFS transporter [Pseudomonas oleovorans]MBN7142920.1 MFS transporter [Pseudomonas oleovorans]MDH1622816.1 MFS transporter [Pseudomonas chengduensis]